MVDMLATPLSSTQFVATVSTHAPLPSPPVDLFHHMFRSTHAPFFLVHSSSAIDIWDGGAVRRRRGAWDRLVVQIVVDVVSVALGYPFLALGSANSPPI